MERCVALCIDELTCRNPELIGLDGEMLDGQEWLEVFAGGEEARSAICEHRSIAEVWVVSCDDVDVINLAAALKADRPDLLVRLVSPDCCGSLLSRAHIAAIDEVVETKEFSRCYGEMKQRALSFRRSGEQVEVAPAARIENSNEAPDVRSARSAVVCEERPVLRDEGALQAQHAAPTEELVIASPQNDRPHIATAGQGFLMPVVSGSGGAGKSAVSVVAAFAASEMGYRTLLLDYDLQFGDAAILSGMDYALPIDEAIERPDKLERELARDSLLTVLAAPDRLEKAESVVQGMPALIGRMAGSYDIIIANTGAAWAEQHAVLLERSHLALFLVDQRASSLRACKHALELCARCGIAASPFTFALNRCAKGSLLTSADVSSALQGEPVYELKDGGRDVEDYLSGGAASELLASGNDFCMSVRHMLERLLPGRGANEDAPATGVSERRGVGRKGRHVGKKRGWKF